MDFMRDRQESGIRPLQVHQSAAQEYSRCDEALQESSGGRAELGQFAGYLRMKVDGFVPYQFNQVKGQPFLVNELVQAFTKLLEE